MKKIFFLIMVVSVSLQAQWEVRGSMGLNVVSMPDLRDYLNANYLSGSERIGDFSSAVETGIEIGYQLEQNYQVACELAYEYNSFTINVFGQYAFSYNLLQPTILGYYTINDTGYQFKFGGGIGPRFVLASETSPYTTSQIKYTSTGYGFVGKIDGITSLGGNFYAYLGFDLRYSRNGTLSDSDQKEKTNNVTNSGLSLSSFSAGIKLGVAVTL